MKMLPTICLIFFISTSSAQNVNKILSDADKQYQKSEYLNASKLYEEALKTSPTDLTAQYNLAVARFRLNEIEGATEAFKKALGLSKDKSMSAKIFYNLGVAFLKSAINQKKKQLNQKQQNSGMSQKELKEQQKLEQKLSKQAAEKILQSAQQEESRVRDSLRSKKSNRQNRATKNW